MLLEILTTYVFPFMFVLTVIVFFHELGHYLAARRNGVKVETFSIGFGTELLGYTDKRGTRWKFCLIPLGGYVKMFSDANAASQPDTEAIQAMSEEDKKHSLVHKSVWARIEVSAAGPLANFVFAFLALAFLYVAFGKTVPSESAKVGFVVQNSPAAEAGLKSGDVIIAVGDVGIKDFRALVEEIGKTEGEISVTYQRHEQVATVKLTPENHAGRQLIGIGPGTDKVHYSVMKSWQHAAVDAYSLTAQTLKGLWRMFTGKVNVQGLSGPIGIAKITGQVSEGGIESLIWFMAFLSINLGIINLLPIPMLDGGHLMFYIVEVIIGRPVSEKKQELAFRAGFIFLISLLIFTTYQDLLKFETIRNLIHKIGW